MILCQRRRRPRLRPDREQRAVRQSQRGALTSGQLGCRSRTIRFTSRRVATRSVLQAANVQLRNNIVVVGAGYGISVALEQPDRVRQRLQPPARNRFRPRRPVAGARPEPRWPTGQRAAYTDPNSLASTRCSLTPMERTDSWVTSRVAATGGTTTSTWRARTAATTAGRWCRDQPDNGRARFAGGRVDRRLRPGRRASTAATRPTRMPTNRTRTADSSIWGAMGTRTRHPRAPYQYVTVIRPDGGEVWPAGQTFAVRWRSHDAGRTVDIELLPRRQSCTHRGHRR